MTVGSSSAPRRDPPARTRAPVRTASRTTVSNAIAEASSISFRRSVRYGFGVLGTALRYRLHHWGVLRYPLLAPLE
jgi:hypothetical protein